MAVGYGTGYLLVFEIINFIFLTVIGLIILQAILKIGFKQYKMGWGDTLKLSAYTFGSISAISYFLKIFMGEAFFMAEGFMAIVLMIVSVLIAKKFLIKVGVKDKIWHLSISWIIATYIVGAILITTIV